METQKEATDRQTAQTAQRTQEEAIMTRKAANPRQLGKQAQVRGEVDEAELEQMMREYGNANDFVIKHGGFGAAADAEVGSPTADTLRMQPAVNSYVKGEQFTANDGVVDGFDHVSDAQFFASVVPPPRPSMYSNPADYADAHDMWTYNKNHYEVFEAPGVQNSFTAGKRGYRIKGTSTARNQDAQGQTRYNLIAAKIQDSWTFVGNLRDTAINIRRVGVGSGGWFNEEEGGFAIPGLFSTDVGTKELQNTTLRLAMGFIKTEDPTARLSDNDIKIGEKAMALSGEGKFVTLVDIFQSLDGDFEDNTIRVAMDRYMQKLALNAQKAIIQQWQNDIVLDYNSSVKFREESNATQRWLNSNKIEN
jgi:hypothetical protein